MMGLIKSSSSGRFSRSKLRAIPSRVLPGRASPAPPQIITSTSIPSISESGGPEHSKSGVPPRGSPSHTALDMPPQDHLKRASAHELRRAGNSASHHFTPSQGLQAAQYPQEDSHLLGVHPHTHPEDRIRRARRTASHPDMHSGSLLSGSLSQRGSGPNPHPSRPNSIAPSIHSGVPPSSFKDLAVLYQVVAERRTAFDNLLWQVPATSLTAHAFLFSISLAADTGRFARIASMGLCIVITVLTLHLFTRQLQAEDADHRWLADFEERHQIEYYDRAHGDRWRDYRAQKPAGAGKLGWLAMHRSYPLWSKGMLIIGFLAVAILILAIFKPTALVGYGCNLQ